MESKGCDTPCFWNWFFVCEPGSYCDRSKLTTQHFVYMSVMDTDTSVLCRVVGIHVFVEITPVHIKVNVCTFTLV